MAKFTEAIANDPGRLYKCDLCKEIFPIRDLQLTDPVDAIMIKACTRNAKFLFVNGEGDVVTSEQAPLNSNNHKILTCPHCGAQHPFGFVPVDDPRMVKEVGHA